MTNAVIYARYSSHSQTEQSIEGQLSAAYKYAAEHKYNIVKEYCDRAKTGTNDNREAFQEMLRDSNKKQFSVLIVWKVDRFGRNREEVAINKHHLKKNGVRIEYVAETIPEGPESVIMESLFEGLAEYYSLQLSQNIMRGKLESAKKFKPVNGSVPLGYKTDKDGHYAIDEENAKLIRLIYEKYLSGETLASLAKWLNDNGYRTKRNQPFTKNSLPRILTNESYIGTYKYKDIIAEENAIPAIIDKQTFIKVQELLSINRRIVRKDWRCNEYLLSGKITCSKCESPMMGESGTSKTGEKYNYYVCSKRHKNGTCNEKRYRSDIIEKKILEDVKDTVLTDEGIEFLTNAIYNYSHADCETTENIKRIESQIADCKRRISNLNKAVEEGMDYSLVKERLSDLQEVINGLELQKSKEEISMPLDLTKECIRTFLSLYKNGDIKDRAVAKRLIKTFVNSVLIDDENITVAYNYCADSPALKSSQMCASESVLPCALEWSRTNDSRTLINIINGCFVIRYKFNYSVASSVASLS